MIIIQPSGGLCNRMRVINSGWKLARERHDQLKVLWNCNAELNCPFESLFQPVKEFKITSIHSVADPRKLFHQKTARHYLTNDEILAHRNADGILDPAYVATLDRQDLYLHLGVVLSIRRLSSVCPHRSAAGADRCHDCKVWIFLCGCSHPPDGQSASYWKKLYGCLYHFYEERTGSGP